MRIIILVVCVVIVESIKMSWKDIIKEEGLPEEYKTILDSLTNSSKDAELQFPKMDELRGKIFKDLSAIENFIDGYNFRVPANKQNAKKIMKVLLDNWKYEGFESGTLSMVEDLIESITEVFTLDMKGKERRTML